MGHKIKILFIKVIPVLIVAVFLSTNTYAYHEISSCNKSVTLRVPLRKAVDNFDDVAEIVSDSNASMFLNLRAAVNGDENAYNTIKSLPVGEAIEYFEKDVNKTVENIPEDLFGFGFGYDIRGNAMTGIKGDVNLTPKNLYAIGKLLGLKYAKEGDSALVTGDGRLHTPIFRYCLALGASSVGVNVDFSEDTLTTGAHNVYAAENPGNYSFQIQISGSHGVYQKNGAKMKVDFGSGNLDPLFGEDLAEMYRSRLDILNEADKREGIGKVNEIKGVEDAVVEMYDKTLPKMIKDEILVIDTRTGNAGPINQKFLNKRGFAVIDVDEVLGVKGVPDADIVTLIQKNPKKILDRLQKEWKKGNRQIAFMLNMHPDPYMRRGIWDPLKPEALIPTKTLINLINSNLMGEMPKAVGGVYDGDADRFTTVKENGEDVPAFEMTIPYYQRFLLDPQNKAAIIEMVKAGGEPLWLALDVRANSKLERTLDKVNKILQEESGIKDRDLLKGMYLNTGYPPQLSFVEYRIKEMKEFIENTPSLKNNLEFMKNFGNLVKTYYTAEASGHNFFHAAPNNLERPCDCGLSAFVSLVNIKETIGDIEASYLDMKKKQDYELTELFETFPAAYTSSEIRVTIPNAIKIKTAKELGKWLKDTFGAELKPTNPDEILRIGNMILQPAGHGFIEVAGFKAQFKDGRSALIRWSNTGEQLNFIFEGTDMDNLIALMEQVDGRASLYEEEGLDLADLRNDIKKQKNIREKYEAAIVADNLRKPLDAKGNTDMASRFLKGGYGQDGYGVAEGAAVNGSDTFKGNQGYFIEDASGEQMGRQIFLQTVNSMREFFERRTKRLGRLIRFVIKPGIGGQHTPFQGIASVFEVIDLKTGKVVGEYELGKDFERAMSLILKEYSADWDQIGVMPSSKSGSTDETMMVFVEIFSMLLKHQAEKIGFVSGDSFSDVVLETLHEVNFINGKERPGKDLFKVDKERFETDSLIALVYNNLKAKNLNIKKKQVKDIFTAVLGNMFFETTDRPDQSRLSAFIRNSGLDKELGEDAPGFGAMFDNVGGRWTGDLHMMAFLAYHGLDAGKYWEIRKEAIRKLQNGEHIGNTLGNKILDEEVTDIAFVVPDEFFWFGKSCEQNFNESIWQKGFANLVTVKKSHWEAQKQHYENNSKKLVINISDLAIPKDVFNIFNLDLPKVQDISKQELANLFAELFSTFYGMTSTVGNRLISWALREAGYTAADVDLNDLDNPATKIVQENLYLRQPYVEFGKGFLEKKLKTLQEEEQKDSGAIDREFAKIKQFCKEGRLQTNLDDLEVASQVTNEQELTDVISKAAEFAKANGRKFVPFIYLEGDRFYNLRDYLSSLGIEWVMQGTGDQHISYQQVLAQPQKYLPFIISFVPEKHLPGRPAIGFAKGYLDNVSSHMVRDLFAEASYQALTESRKDEGGLGLFLRLTDSDEKLDMLKNAMTAVFQMRTESIRTKDVRSAI